MNYQHEIAQRLKMPLAQHPYLSVEFDQESFFTTIENRSPNVLGHYAGGDIAYLATASAAMQCVAEGILAQVASMSIDVIGKGDADLLLAKTKIVHTGKKLIRTQCEVFGRKAGELKLVAIAQLTMSPLSDQTVLRKAARAEKQAEPV